MAPVVFLPPALKTLLATLAPWLAGAAAAGGIAGYHRAINAQLRTRLGHVGEMNGQGNMPASEESDLGPARDKTSPSASPNTEPLAPSGGAEISDDASSPKRSFLRKIMESNITLRKQPAE